MLRRVLVEGWVCLIVISSIMGRLAQRLRRVMSSRDRVHFAVAHIRIMTHKAVRKGRFAMILAFPFLWETSL